MEKSNLEVKELLQPIFEQAKGKLNTKEETFVNEDNLILLKLKTYFENTIITKLNSDLRKKMPILENISDIINLNKISAKMNGNDIETLAKIVNQIESLYLFGQEDSNNFNYNLQLNLNFEINFNSKTDTFIYNPKSAFITADKKELDDKIINLADKLSKSLVNQELNAKTIIDNVLDNNITYTQSFSNELNNILKNRNIEIKKSQNMEINREQLSFSLKPPKSDLKYIKDFVVFINNSETVITTSEELFSKSKGKFYQFNDYTIEKGKIFIKNFKEFVITNWSIEGIELPQRTLNNIKIYHEISEIKKSWKNFYKIFIQYFNKYKENKNEQAFKANMLFSIYNEGLANDLSEFKKKSSKVRLEQWNSKVKSQINSEILKYFFININSGDYYSGDISDSTAGYYAVNIKNTSIQLFFNELSLFLTNNENIFYMYRKKS